VEKLAINILLKNQQYVLDKAVSKTPQTKLRTFLQESNAALYRCMVYIACNTTASVFKFLLVFFLTEYSRKHDTVSGKPN